MAAVNPRVQVTVDPELGDALAPSSRHPASKSRLIRDLALRGAEAAAEEQSGATRRSSSSARSPTARSTYDFDALGETIGERERSRRPSATDGVSAASGSGLPLVIDTSAWHRQREAAFADAGKATLRAGLLVSCPAATLEILGSTRDEREFAAFDAALAALPQAPVTASVCQRRTGRARELGARRRLAAIDYLIAAAAAERGFGVLHADSHFDLLAGVLDFESVNVMVG